MPKAAKNQESRRRDEIEIENDILILRLILIEPEDGADARSAGRHHTIKIFVYI